jgi:putative salt-induced outer membrane protein YdiY
VAALFSSARALTAIPNPNAPKPVSVATNKPSLWENTLSFGLTLTRGNSDTMLMDSALKSHRNDLTNEVTLSLEGTYGENHSTKNNESLRGIGQYNHLFSERFYAYGRGDGFHDDIADLTYRFTLSPGIGYYFIKKKGTQLAVEAGPSCVLEKLDGSRQNYAAARVAERFEHKFDGKARLWENVEFLPQFDKGDNFLLNAEVGVETPLTKRISLSVVAQDNYINLPAPGRERNDLKLISGLIYKF